MVGWEVENGWTWEVVVVVVVKEEEEEEISKWVGVKMVLVFVGNQH
jgi:hypothetical protein